MIWWILGIALAQDGGGGAIGGLGTWTAPPPPATAPIGRKKDHRGMRLPEIARVRLGEPSEPGVLRTAHLVETPHGVVVGNGRAIVLYDARGTEVRRVDQPHRGLALHGDTLWVLDGEGVLGTATLPGLEVSTVDRAWRAPTLQFLRAEADAAPRFPTRPSVAAGGDVVAYGLEELSVALDGQVFAYELVDQVHLDLRDPRGDVFGGMGGSSRNVDPRWDPQAVRPRSLHLEDVAVSADGHRVAMLWTYLVTDAYGDERQRDWLGVLDPYRNGLAGKVVRGGDRLALSADGTHVFVLGETVAEGFVLPPTPEVEVAPPTNARDAIENVESEVTVGLLLGSPFDGYTEGIFGAAPNDPAVHRGLAQPLPSTATFGAPRLQGWERAAALSSDGRWLAVASDAETALVRVGEGEPVWRYDLGQGGTDGLFFGTDTLWVVGRDGTVLGIQLPPS